MIAKIHLSNTYDFSNWKEWTIVKSTYQVIKTVLIFLLTISIPALFILSGGFRDTDLGFFALPWYINFAAVLLYTMPVIVPLTEVMLAIDRFITKKPCSDKLKKLDCTATVSSVIVLLFFTIVFTFNISDNVIISVFTAITSIMLATWIILLILRHTSVKEKISLLPKILNIATPIMLVLTTILYIQNLFVFRTAAFAVLIYFILTIITIWILKLCKFRNEIKKPAIYYNKSFWITATAVLITLLIMTSIQ